MSISLIGVIIFSQINVINHGNLLNNKFRVNSSRSESTSLTNFGICIFSVGSHCLNEGLFNLSSLHGWVKLIKVLLLRSHTKQLKLWKVPCAVHQNGSLWKGLIQLWFKLRPFNFESYWEKKWKKKKYWSVHMPDFFCIYWGEFNYGSYWQNSIKLTMRFKCL